jgi:hypothetical protein
MKGGGTGGLCLDPEETERICGRSKEGPARRTYGRKKTTNIQKTTLTPPPPPPSIITSKSVSQSSPPLLQRNVLGGGVFPIMKETDRKLRSAVASHDEAEDGCKLELLGSNQVRVNGATILHRDYNNFVRETDMELEWDEHWKACKMPPLPPPTAPNCQAPPCRLGCICESIVKDSVARTHCGKPECFFECTCQLAVFPNGEDTNTRNIRSPLRSRVSLLNWRYMEPTEREKDPPPVS